MSADLRGVWPQTQIAQVVAELTVWEEHPPPYLNAFLGTVGQLPAGAGLRSSSIQKVKAAWEYEDEQQKECGFLVGLTDGRCAYLEGRRIRITGQAIVTARQVAVDGSFRDVAASSAAGAAGWVEDPEELNAFLQRIAGETQLET